MKLDKIKLKALQETSTKEIDRILTTIDSKLEHTKAFDIEIPYHLMDYIENALDSIDIPCYRVHDTCLSVADSYKTLVKREGSGR